MKCPYCDDRGYIGRLTDENFCPECAAGQLLADLRWGKIEITEALERTQALDRERRRRLFLVVGAKQKGAGA